MEALTVDCRTGEKTRHKLTPEEVAAHEAAAVSAATDEHLLQQERQEAIERLRGTEIGRDILILLGVDK